MSISSIPNASTEMSPSTSPPQTVPDHSQNTSSQTSEHQASPPDETKPEYPSGSLLDELRYKDEIRAKMEENRAKRPASVEEAPSSPSVIWAPLEKIKIWDKCLRSEFTPENLAEITDSIRERGLAQPVIIQPMEDGDYRLIAGYRRYYAHRELKLREIKASVVPSNFSDEHLLMLAITENVQRENLTPLQTAEAYQNLMSISGRSQTQTAKLLGIAKSSLSEYLSLLKFPDDIKDQIRNDSRYKLGRLINLVKASSDELYKQFVVYQNELGISPHLTTVTEKQPRASAETVFKDEKKRKAKLTATSSFLSLYESQPEILAKERRSVALVCCELLRILGYKEEREAVARKESEQPGESL